ncbi:MAG TPA: VOC family protein [Albitalea sp.]|nr:VOC family protein [Albitalea sp.]
MKKSTDKASILANADAVANVAVKDLEEARAFYEGMLGLSLVDAEGREALVFKSGNG